MIRSQGRPSGQKSTETRKNIALAYIQICYIKGPEWINLKTVALQAGYTLAAVRYQFPKGVDEIRSVAFEVVSLSGKAFTDEQLSLLPYKNPVDLLHNYINVTFKWFQVHREFAAFWIYAFFEAARSTQNQSLLNQKNIEVQKAHKRIFDILLSLPKLNDQLLDTLEETAIELHTLLLGFVLNAICDRRPQAMDVWRKRTLANVSYRLNIMI